MAFRHRFSRALSELRGTQKRSYYGGRGGGRGGYGLTQGGITNPLSGLGTELDKSEAAYFTPTRISHKSPLEVLYVQSWAALKFCRIPVDDMFQLPRNWKDGDVEGTAETMRDAEKRHHAIAHVREAMVSARVYGTAVMVLFTDEAPMETELDPRRIREGDLSAIHVFDRFELSVIERDRDLWSPNFGNPSIYRVQPSWGSAPIPVHHSRALRFDGIKPPGSARFYNYDSDWGVSNLVPVITALLHDASFAAAVAHMAQEASIPVLKISGFHDLISGTAGDHEQSIDALGRAMNTVKSVFRMFMMDKDESDFTRVAVAFGGLSDLLNAYAARLAAAGDIPITRFMASSPAGMNATGESDWRNYVVMNESLRASKTAHVFPILDEVVARDAGLRETPEFEWQSLLEMSDKDKADIAKTKAEAFNIALQASAIDEDEVRKGLDGDPIFGELQGDAPEAPDPLEIPVQPDNPFGGVPPPTDGPEEPEEEPK